MSAFEINKRYIHSMPIGNISDTGIKLICEYLTNIRPSSDELWKQTNVDRHLPYVLSGLPDDWSYTWLVTGRGEYVGTFPKRIAKYYYQTHKIKMPSSILSQIGNIAKDHSSDIATYEFDFTDTFDWQSGDYGDSGSCYWGSYSSAKELLSSNGGLAIRFYKDNQGYGRAWIMPHNECYYLFNGYGLQLVSIARILSSFLNLSYKAIRISAIRYIYINGGNQYVVGDVSAIADITSYHINVDGDIEDEDNRQCDCCDDTYHYDDMYYTEDDYCLCESCYTHETTTCYDCNCTYWHDDDMRFIENINSNVCESCYEQSYSMCDSCADYFSNDVLTNTSGDDYVCESCLEEYAHCESCEQLIESNRLIEHDDLNYCESCYAELSLETSDD